MNLRYLFALTLKSEPVVGAMIMTQLTHNPVAEDPLFIKWILPSPKIY